MAPVCGEPTNTAPLTNTTVSLTSVISNTVIVPSPKRLTIKTGFLSMYIPVSSTVTNTTGLILETLTFGLSLQSKLGEADGETDGLRLGDTLGDTEGEVLGDREGLTLGLIEGDILGLILGLSDGLIDGEIEGLILGDTLGEIDGDKLGLGDTDGLTLGLTDGD